MVKSISVILFVLLFFGDYFAQPKPFGYKISGNGDIISDVFFIKEGFVLDSIIYSEKTFRFEYDKNGKLKRDINFHSFFIVDSVTGRKIVPGYRDYFYNERGDVDSVGMGIWNGSQSTADSTSYRISYTYDNEGNILSKTYSRNGVTFQLEENNYDSSGNLILNKESLNGNDSTITVREYDLQNRLIKTRSSQYRNNHINQVLYQYENSGNINLTIQSTYNFDSPLNNARAYYLEFDQYGKLVYEIQYNSFNPAHSTWSDSLEIICDYDENGNLLKMGDIVRFNYNDDGNLDTLVNTHAIYCGYLGNNATLLDSYGNSIKLTNSQTLGVDNFYYSNFITDVKGSKLNNISFSLSQNYPNPFNPVTSITYTLPKNSLITLKIYDILGKEIATLVNEEKQSGTYSAAWNASDMASGIYFYKITAGEYSKTNKMLLLK